MILDCVDILDSAGTRACQRVEIADGKIHAVIAGDPPEGPRPLLCPSLVDLQVNGGGGRMVNDAQGPGDLRHIMAAHSQLGTGHILPTLISDTTATTARIIEIARATPNLLGLHLEGPHLAIAGAHDPKLLRPMTDADLALYLEAARRLPKLMITLAPEQVQLDQITALTRAGVIVALGHSNCSYGAAKTAFDAGAAMVTHLFNAMSGLHHREPGLVGAALDGRAAFGLIADGHHVHDAALRLALAQGQGRAIPVSDAMALTGSDAASFQFQGREIRADGTRLSLGDGTLAGARASLLDGLRHLARITDTDLTEHLPMGFDRPWQLLGCGPRRLRAGDPADLLRVQPDGTAEVLIEEHWHPIPG